MEKEFSNKNWVLKTECLNYMKKDGDVIFDAIKFFENKFYDPESINITKFSSLSTISLNTFLTNYSDPENNTIHIPKQKEYNDIRNAFTVVELKFLNLLVLIFLVMMLYLYTHQWWNYLCQLV